MSLGFALLLGQNKLFKDVKMGNYDGNFSVFSGNVELIKRILD